MISTRVFVDANVLYSRTLRDWLALLQLGAPGEIYTVYWTEDVLAETIYHLRRSHPEWDGGKITKIRDRIAATFEGGRVEDFIIDDTFPGSDGDDRHVHAAAVACRADIVLTCDGGFHVCHNADSLPYEVYDPDEFFLLVDDSAPHLVRDVTKNQALYWAARLDERPDLAASLINAGCPSSPSGCEVIRGSSPTTLPPPGLTPDPATARPDAKHPPRARPPSAPSSTRPS